MRGPTCQGFLGLVLFAELSGTFFGGFSVAVSNYVKVWSLVSLVNSLVLGQVEEANGSPQVVSGVGLSHSVCQSINITQSPLIHYEHL